MKLLIVSTGIQTQPAIHGGAVETLIDMLIEYNEEHHICDISLYALYAEKAEEISKKYYNTKVKYIKRNFVINKAYINNLIPTTLVGAIYINKVIKELQKLDEYDMIVVENEFKYGKKLKKVIQRKNLILHLHNDYINKNVKEVQKKIECYGNILVVSDYLKKRIYEVDKNINVNTVYNGIDISRYQLALKNNNRNILRKKYGIFANEIVVVFAGRICEEKGIKELMVAIKSIPTSYTIRLVVIGGSTFEGSKETPFIKELKQIAKPLKDRVIFTGYVPHDQIADIYSIADIGCVPSVWDEPFGLTVIEQMAMGLPLIVSDSGAIPEIVDESCAIFVKRGDQFIKGLEEAVMELYSNKVKRNEMGKNALKKVQRFSKEKYAEDFFRHIKSSINMS